MQIRHIHNKRNLSYRERNKILCYRRKIIRHVVIYSHRKGIDLNIQDVYLKLFDKFMSACLKKEFLTYIKK